MRITKEQNGGQPVAVTPEELEQINLLSRKTLTEEEVYVFSVKLCDNEIDRDGECFPRETLEGLAPLFLGKGGIFDHSWSAKGQSARLFSTQVVEEGGVVTQGGEVYCYLKGLAYMIRTDDNTGLIAEIEGGIKKEVSVGCSVKRSVCSICGEDIQHCVHQKGECYDGRLCYTLLLDAQDAYEFSFVAVPAQPRAGVMRQKGQPSLKSLAKEFPVFAPQLQQLEEEAKLGRKYLSELREDVVRLGLLAESNMSTTLLRGMVEKMSQGELATLKTLFESQAKDRYPLGVQLRYGEVNQFADQDSSFLI